MKFFVRWVVLSVALWVAVVLVDGLRVDGGPVVYLLTAAVFGFVNTVIGKAFRLLTAPLILLSFGFFLLVINALMLLLTAFLVPSFEVDGLGSAIIGGVVVSVVSFVLNAVVAGGRFLRNI